MTAPSGGAALLVCDCEPEVFSDGSRLHADDCDVFPWCPHEAVAAVCLMPCGCPCARCAALTDAHKREASQ